MTQENMMSKRKQLSPEEKVAAIRRHLVENVPVSDLCDELGVHPNQYYNWQKQFFENGAAAFARRPNNANEARRRNANEKKIEQLEKKVQDRNEVVAELMQEHVQLKKELGEL
jgi:transposase